MVEENAVKIYKKKRIKAMVITSVIALIVVFGLFVYGYGEYITMKELGQDYLDVFLKNFTVKSVVMLVSFIVIFTIFFVTTNMIKKICKGMLSPIMEYLDKRWIPPVVSLVISIVAGSYVSGGIYDTFLLFANRVDFGITDPIFGADIGYYVFTRPFLAALINSAINVWLVATIYCLGAYMLIYFSSGEYEIADFINDKKAVLHNIINVAVFFLLKAITYNFTSEEILYSSMGETTGAGFTDVFIWLNYYRVAPFLLILLVGLSIFFWYKAKYKRILYTVAVYPVVYILVAVISFGVQMLVVNPNESVKEAQFIGHNIKYTKLAYNIDDVIETEFPAENNLTAQDIIEYDNVLENVRVTDYNSTVTAYNSLQGIRNFYKFNDADVSKYNISGRNTLAMVSARELNLEGLDEGAKNYTNKYYRYTHGFGAVMSPLNRVTQEGQPEFLISNIPPVSEENVPEITQPRIYYGEMDNNQRSIVNSTIKEIDYVDGSTAEEYSYSGNGGVQMTTLNRLVFALKNKDFQMLISDYIKEDSRLIINRNVVQRVKMAVPFIKFDEDPYLVVDAGGNLKWIVDGYTTTTYYPYAQTYEEINYIRNSVKAVVDAYNGDIKLYVVDKNDPLIKSYMKIYPYVFDNGEMPEDLREHIVYPEYLFRLQAQVYGKYHVSDVNTFYNKSDSWIFTKERYNNEVKDIEPYYNMLKIDEFPETDENFVIMVPYTLQGKQNMQSWFAASCDYNNYGKMVSYQFPKGKNVYGTEQIESRIDNDANISQKMTLWDQGGSNVIRGNTLVVPIKSSLIYIEPVYITTSQSTSSIPELKQVIVCYDDKIVMEATLEAALGKLFGVDLSQGVTTESDEALQQDSDGQSTPDTSVDNTQKVTVEDVINGVIDAYDTAMQSNQSGDWEQYGKDMQSLKEEIDKLRQYK